MSQITEDITVSIENLFVFLVQSLRYAMGRRSYATSETPDLIRKYWKFLDINRKQIILRDLREELEKAESWNGHLGDEMDHRNWKSLYKDISEVP